MPCLATSYRNRCRRRWRVRPATDDDEVPTLAPEQARWCGARSDSRHEGKRKVLITPTSPNGGLLQDQAREYLIPKGKHSHVQPGDRVRAGDPLMDGPPNPHDILRVKGERELAAWLVNEIQHVYRLQGVLISDKHIEVIVRQMLRRVRVKEVGDSAFLVDEQVEKHVFEHENEKVLEALDEVKGSDVMRNLLISAGVIAGIFVIWLIVERVTRRKARVAPGSQKLKS